MHILIASIFLKLILKVIRCIMEHSCQNVNRTVNRFFIFCIMYHKIHKHLIKFIKNYRYTYIKGIFIISFEYIQLITNLFITYVIIFNKLTK